MARQALRPADKTLLLYEEIATACRAHGTDWGKVSRLTNTPAKAVRDLYERGWPEHEWAPPLTHRFMEEAIATRAAMEDTDTKVARILQDDVVANRIRDIIREEALKAASADITQYQSQQDILREKAKANALQARTEETELAQRLRSRASVLLSAAAPALPELLKLGKVLEKRIALYNTLTEPQIAQLDPHDLIQLMRAYTELQLKIATLATAAQVIDRKAAGEPDFIMGHRDSTMSYDDALKVIQTAGTLALQHTPLPPHLTPPNEG